MAAEPPKPAPSRRLLIRRGLIILAGVVFLVSFLVVLKYWKLVDQKLTNGPYRSNSLVLASPRAIRVGDVMTPQELYELLYRSGYRPAEKHPIGTYVLRNGTVEIHPGPSSYFAPDPAAVTLTNGKVSRIVALKDGQSHPQYLLEPELISNLADRTRERRRPVAFTDVPPVLIQAVVATEDRRFFQHSGLDPLRIVKALYVDVKEGEMEQGASTLSMQLARTFFLNQQKTVRRKLEEALITALLEIKLTKQQIFEYYANAIYLGQHGSFSINGFGEAARTYLGKELHQITLPEAALLAGMIQRPMYLNPYKWPDRAKSRRRLVLQRMLENKFIDEPQRAAADAAPLQLATAQNESDTAPYFLDLVNDDLQERFQDKDVQARSYRIFTTLDMDLQRAAVAAAQIGMKEVDRQLARQIAKDKVVPQVALVALDAHTGELKALVGGRDYSASQLNHAVAKRQPGSVFKPFVYAAALGAALDGGQKVTPASYILDEPTTFKFGREVYQPSNYHNRYMGEVTVRQALMNSLNIPTIKLAEMVGFKRVVQIAREAGITTDLQPTPSIALGSYEATPLDMAQAYTIFSNGGTRAAWNYIRVIRDGAGATVQEAVVREAPVLDPRVAYLLVNLMEDVVRAGTAAGVRSRGFTLPAAGKTGTSRDGWFAGFTNELICVVWVGYDDNRELGLEGAKSALPIWTEFMKRAHSFPAYRNAAPFQPPKGVVRVTIDPTSGGVATAECPYSRSEVYLEGTQPKNVCPGHGPGAAVEVSGQQEEPGRKRGFWGRVADVFR